MNRRSGYYWVKEPHSNIASIAYYSDAVDRWAIYRYSKIVKDDYFQQIGYRVTQEPRGPKRIKFEELEDR